LSENEGRAFLVVKGFDLNFASYMMTVSWIGYAIGCPLLGFLSDYFQRRKNMMVLSSFFNLVSITGIIFSTNRFALIGAFFLLGLGASGQSIGFATIAEQFKRQFTSVAFGLNNGMITSIAAINAPILGWALDYAKKLHYSALFQYYIAFSILIIIALLSCIFSIFFIKETFNKSYVDFTYLKTKMRY
jgi:MFS family permease